MLKEDLIALHKSYQDYYRALGYDFIQPKRISESKGQFLTGSALQVFFEELGQDLSDLSSAAIQQPVLWSRFISSPLDSPLWLPFQCLQSTLTRAHSLETSLTHFINYLRGYVAADAPIYACVYEGLDNKQLDRYLNDFGVNIVPWKVDRRYSLENGHSGRYIKFFAEHLDGVVGIGDFVIGTTMEGEAFYETCTFLERTAFLRRGLRSYFEFSEYQLAADSIVQNSAISQLDASLLLYTQRNCLFLLAEGVKFANSGAGHTLRRHLREVLAHIFPHAPRNGVPLEWFSKTSPKEIYGNSTPLPEHHQELVEETEKYLSKRQKSIRKLEGVAVAPNDALLLISRLYQEQGLHKKISCKLLGLDHDKLFPNEPNIGGGFRFDPQPVNPTKFLLEIGSV